MILAPVFLAGLAIYLPFISRYLSRQAGLQAVPGLWQMVVLARWVCTILIIGTTSLLFALSTLPFFGFLMTLGLLCQLNVIKDFVSSGRQKLAHTLCEIALVIGGILITGLSSWPCTPFQALYFVLAMIIVWWCLYWFGRSRFNLVAANSQENQGGG